MKSFVRSSRSGRSRRGHGDKDEVEVSEDEIFDARGMFEGEADTRESNVLDRMREMRREC